MTNPSPVLREAPPRLAEIQAPVEEELAGVIDELRRIVVSDFHMIEEVNEYLLLMRGKLFRPTLLLLSNAVESDPGREGVILGAVVELVHLATLVHDDAVDHSVLRRGLPTVNSLWTHQVAIIMGDYLYSRSVTELADLDEPRYIRVLAQAANEMSVGEMRQLTSYDALDFSEEEYDSLIEAKTASLMAAACEMGAIAGGGRHREALRSFGRSLGMAFQIADDLLDYTGNEEVTGSRGPGDPALLHPRGPRRRRDRAGGGDRPGSGRARLRPLPGRRVRGAGPGRAGGASRRTRPRRAAGLGRLRGGEKPLSGDRHGGRGPGPIRASAGPRPIGTGNLPEGGPVC